MYGAHYNTRFRNRVSLVPRVGTTKQRDTEMQMRKLKIAIIGLWQIERHEFTDKRA